MPQSSPPWLKIACEEPFRVFFPLAFFAGFIGIGLWPLFFTGGLGFYPSELHARILIQGFMGGFIIGFLSTALPRMLDTIGLTPFELLLYLFLYIVSICSHITQSYFVGDVVFLLLLIVHGSVMCVRFIKRKDLPPPSFVLVIFGYLSAVSGILLLNQARFIEYNYFSITLGRNLLYQGFILFPLLGVSSFLIPRFLGFANRQAFPESCTPPPGWTVNALTAASVGSLILLGFWLEHTGLTKVGGSIRALTAAGYLFFSLPLYRLPKIPGLHPLCLHAGLWLMLIGLCLLPIITGYRLIPLHTLFIGGFSLITITVATRVIFGHSGHGFHFKSRMHFIGIITLFILISLDLRITADLLPLSRNIHLALSAVSWMIAVLIWAAIVLPKVIVPDPDP